MKVLVGCEESQAVCKAFREREHEAYSCDLQECSGGHPEWHIQQDIVQTIALGKWDLIILHPPCTALAVSGNATYAEGMPKYNERLEAIKWTEALWNLATSVCDRVVLENPVGVLPKHTKMPKPHYVQPWQFGHKETKKTGLWYYGVRFLKPTNIVDPEFIIGKDGKRYSPTHYMTKHVAKSLGMTRGMIRSKTYQGIAKAMAEQWG